jgi:pimeloyl-ACP methyl ester carboxylesterase
MRIAIAIISTSLGLLWSAACAQSPAASEGLTETFHVVPLTRGGDLNVLVSKRSGTNPTIAALLFPGYPGILRLRNEAGAVTYTLMGNFLVRARRFLNSDKVFTVLVDCPVDQWSTCSDAYRSSSQHAADIADVVAAVKTTFGAQQAYIVGTSYGTVSSSFLAKNLADKIEGAVHTATFTDPRSGRNAHGVPMRSFDWTQTKVPQLFVHHKDDPCDVTRYSSVAERRKDIPLITVEGVANPRGEPCMAFSAHGFVGRERAVMTAIHDWITDRKIPAVVGQRD